MAGFFINNNRFSYLLLVILVAVGAYSLFSIPRESAPEVQVPVGIVTTTLPGASALDVEALVTNELERGLIGNLEDVAEIRSNSREGVSSITVEFDPSADIDESISALEKEIDTLASELPDNAEEPQVSEVDFVDQPIMSIAVSAPQTSLGLRQLAKSVEAELEAISGVSRVTITGVAEREVRVMLDPTALERFAMTPNDVVNGLRAANTAFPVGSIVSDNTAYNVVFDGDIASPATVRNTPLTNRSGQTVYVSDVAEVSDGLAPASTYSRLSVAGEPSQQSFTLDVYKQNGGDITAIAADVRAKLSALQAADSLLSDATVETLFDSGQDIRDDLIQLSSSGLQTVVLVMIVLVVALGWREAFIAGTAIPLSFLIGFIGLYFSGNTINFLSLFSLILGIGILVDSGIVMVEGINRRLKEDPTGDKKRAALQAIREFAAPLIAGTLTTVSMFVGLFIVSGVTGQFIASIPFTLIFVLFASLFVALAILPLLSATFLKRRSATRFEQRQTEYAHRLEAWYAAALRAFLQDEQKQKRFRWSIRLLLLAAIALPILGAVQVIFFEQGDVPFMYVEAELPTGTTLEVTDLTARQIEESLYNVTSIASFQTTVGAGSQFGSGGRSENTLNLFINLTEDRDQSSSELVSVLQERLRFIDEADVTVSQPNNGPPTGAPINLRFVGSDLTELTTVAATAEQALAQTEGVVNISSPATESALEYVLTFKADLAAQYGLSAQSVSSALRSTVFGAEATSISSLDESIDVVVQQDLSGNVGYEPRQTNVGMIEDIEAIPLTTPSGDTVFVGTLVDVSVREAQRSIAHVEGERVVTVSADVEPGYNARDIQASFIESFQDSHPLPATVRLETAGGESEESNQAFIEMFIALIAGVLLMIAVLVLQFNSYLHTRYVLTILPYSLIGILFGLALTGNSLSFPSLMGFIALSGIVVNNSILLIDLMNHQRRKHPGKPMEDIVVDAASNRLRPILLTTITTVIGMVPLTYADDIWAPLAYAVMFGLLFSVVITLVLIPIIYFRKPGELGTVTK